MSSFNKPILNRKLDHVIKQLKCSANVTFAFGFILKNFDDGTCRIFYAHENITVMRRSKLTCTQNDNIKLKKKLQKMDIVNHCTRDGANTKRGLYKFKNVTVFALLL